MKVSDLKVNEYQLWEAPDSSGQFRSITLVRRTRRDEPDRWAITDGDSCLTKSGKWEYERIPSNRTAAFFKRCRFDSPEDALALWVKKKIAAKLDAQVEERRQLIEARTRELEARGMTWGDYWKELFDEVSKKQAADAAAKLAVQP